MLMKLDRNQEMPLYQQIIDEIKQHLDRGALHIGQTLPSSRKLAETLGVNRTTVNRAYEELQAQGYLSSRPGSYNRVQKRRKEAEYNPRRISDEAKEGLRASMERFGLVQPIIWNRRTERVVRRACSTASASIAANRPPT